MRALTPLRPIAPAVDTVVKDGAAVMSPIGPDSVSIRSRDGVF